MILPRSVLVTGGAGYIGSHIAKALARHGLQPVVLDNLATGNRWAVKWGPLVEGDICEEALVRHTVHHYKIEAVIHLAANAYVGGPCRTRGSISETMLRSHCSFWML